MTDRPSALVDTNVLIDVLLDDPVWAEWSVGQLEIAALQGVLLINDVVYAELSVRAPTMEALDGALDLVGVQLSPTPRAALFLAGKAFERYRSLGGPRSSVLPDFFIGAHAAALGVPLLTRDPKRYRSYFPKLQLVSP